MSEPWLLVAFVVGAIFGGAFMFSLLVLLLTEDTITVQSSDSTSDGWKYE